jgi:hypothetical protein
MWERIPETNKNQYMYTDRLQVPGGWLIRTWAWSSGSGGVALQHTFVEDSNHTWTLPK